MLRRRAIVSVYGHVRCPERPLRITDLRIFMFLGDVLCGHGRGTG